MIAPDSSSASNPFVFGLPGFRLLYMIIPDTPETDPHTDQTSSKCYPISRSVTVQAFEANPLPVTDVRMIIVNTSICNVKDVAK